MDRLFLMILNMSLTGAFVIAVICLIRLPLKKVPKIMSYCLWAVAGFRLMVPFSFESVLSLVPFRAQTISVDIAMQAVPRINSGIAVVDGHINNAPMVLPEIYTSAASAVPWLTLITYTWLLGAIAMLIYGVATYLMLKRKMRDSICIDHNIYEADNIKSPFVLGIIRPKIFLPIGLSADEYEYIMLHEQTHVRRRDHIVKFVAYFILALHWFNPLAWVAFVLMGADMEMSCDERVLKEMGLIVKISYSRSLISFASKRRFVATSPLAFGEGGIKERVQNVLKFKKCSRVVVVTTAVLAIALSAGLMLSRTEAMGSYEGQSEVANIPDVAEVLEIFPENTPRDESYWRGLPIPGVGWLLTQMYSEINPNELIVSYAVSDGAAWGSAEETVLMENARLVLERHRALQNVIFHISGVESGVDESIHTIAYLTATRYAGNGVGQWCIEERQSRSVPPWVQVDVLGRPIFQWMPEGYYRESVHTFVGTMPLPDSEWRVEGMEIGNSFIEYGPHVYSMTVQYVIPYGGSIWWLTHGAEEILLENAAQMFVNFDDLMRIGFAISKVDEIGTTHDFHLMVVDRDDIVRRP